MMKPLTSQHLEGPFCVANCMPHAPTYNSRSLAMSDACSNASHLPLPEPHGVPDHLPGCFLQPVMTFTVQQ